MSEIDSISIDEALKWFELDSHSIDEKKVKRAYKRLAQKYHPDKKYNFKEKNLAQNKFVYTGQVRKVLENALRTGQLPRVVTSSSSQDQFSNAYESNYSIVKDTQKHSPPAWVMEKKLSDYLFDIPVIGTLMAIPLVFGFIFMAIGGVLVYLPLSIIFAITGNKGEKLKKHLWELASGLPLIPIYFFLAYVSAAVIGEESEVIFWSIFICSSLAVLLIALEELYAMFKYFGKRKSRELSVYKEL